MPRVHTQKARTDIYRTGLRIKADNKQGYSLDRSKPANEEDQIFIKKGQTYYSWQLHRSPRQLSLTYPKPQQLTNSGFMQSVYDIQDQISDLSPSDLSELEESVENIKDDLRNLQDETQNSLDNMPESLQYAPTGELLQERIDALEEVVNELESIDFDIDSDLEEDSDEYAEALQNIVDEVQQVSFNF